MLVLIGQGGPRQAAVLGQQCAPGSAKERFLTFGGLLQPGIPLHILALALYIHSTLHP